MQEIVDNINKKKAFINAIPNPDEAIIEFSDNAPAYKAKDFTGEAVELKNYEDAKKLFDGTKYKNKPFLELGRELQSHFLMYCFGVAGVTEDEMTEFVKHQKTDLKLKEKFIKIRDDFY